MRPPRKVPTVSTHGGRLEYCARDRHDAPHLAVLNDQIGRLLLEQREVRRVLQSVTDELPIQLPVGLRTRRPHGGSIAGIEGPELDAGVIRGAGHDAAQGIDLTHQVALADTAPIAGLQLICPSVSMLWVNSNVRAPRRAAASAASVPAWPPPMTITSKGCANRMQSL